MIADDFVCCSERKQQVEASLRMELPGRRKRGRPKRKFMDAVKEDMRIAGVTDNIVWDRLEWRKKIRCGDP